MMLFKMARECQARTRREFEIAVARKGYILHRIYCFAHAKVAKFGGMPPFVAKFAASRLAHRDHYRPPAQGRKHICPIAGRAAIFLGGAIFARRARGETFWHSAKM
jgi:hypothetical protein